MSAVHHGCGCLVNCDEHGLVINLSPCDPHRHMLQPELEALRVRLQAIRSAELLRPSRRRAPSEGPDIDVVFIDEEPLPLTREMRRPKGPKP